MTREGIAVAGSILVDKIYGISAYPSSGELTQIKSIDFAVGGMVPNDAIDIKRIRPSVPVYAIGRVGGDAEGEFVVSALRDNGVNTDGIVVGEGEKTSFTDVMSVVGGQRTFFTYPGASANFGMNDVDFDSLTCKMLHLGYFLLLEQVDRGDGLEILKRASAEGIKTSIDLVSESSDRYSLIRPCLPYVDNLIVNEVEACRLCGIEPSSDDLGAVAQRLKEYGVKYLRVFPNWRDFQPVMQKYAWRGTHGEYANANTGEPVYGDGVDAELYETYGNEFAKKCCYIISDRI